MALCLVTGSTGLIGYHLVKALIAIGHQVRVLDNGRAEHQTRPDRIIGPVEKMAGLLTDLDTIRMASKGVELVFHQAGHCWTPGNAEDPVALHHACATGTLFLLVASREAGVRRVIYGSSASVYGNATKLPRSEEDPTTPVSQAGVAQLTGELYCKAFSQLYGLETVRLRYFNVFGPNKLRCPAPPGVIPRFLQRLLAARSPVIDGDGLQTRDFTYVSDVVQANLLAAEARRVSGKVYNIAFGSQHNLLDVLAYMNEILNSRIKPIHIKPRPGDVRDSVADTTRAQRELGFCPCMDLKEGLRKCIEYHRSQLLELSLIAAAE
jgi:UDP-glucose 4-epimerase